MTTLIQAGDQLNFIEPKVAINKIYPADTNWCTQCGKKCGANPWFAEVIKGGEIRLQDGTDYNSSTDAGYMGWWVVGNECAKKFAPNLLFKYSN